MSLKDCLSKIRIDADDKREIYLAKGRLNGDEKAAVQSYIDGLVADIEDARAQLIEQGFEVALPVGEQNVAPAVAGSAGAPDSAAGAPPAAVEQGGGSGDAAPQTITERLNATSDMRAKEDMAAAWVLEQGRATGVEFAVVLSRTGERIEVSSGHAKGVSFNDRTFGEARAGRVGFTVHNHPSSSGPSVSDLAMLAMGFDPMRIVGHDGELDVEIRRGTLAAIDFQDAAAVNRMTLLFDAIFSDVHAATQRRIDAGEISFDAATSTRNMIQAMLLDRMGLIDLIGNIPDLVRTRGVNADAIIAEVYEQAANGLRWAGYDVLPIGDRGGDRQAGSPARAPSGRRGAAPAASQSPSEGNAGGRVSAPGLTGRRRGPQPQFARRVDMFYSPLAQGLENAKQASATAQDWKAIIAKLDGVKRAEVEWLGVEDWLDGQAGQVSREALTAFVRANEIVIEEEVGAERDDSPDIYVDIDYDSAIMPDDEFFAAEAEVYADQAREELEADAEDPGDISDADVQERAEELARQNYELTSYRVYVKDENGDWEAEGTYDAEAKEFYVNGNTFDTRADLMRWAEQEAMPPDGADFEANFSDTRTPDYNEPGGSNYREILLRVPDLNTTGRNRVRLSPEDQAEYDAAGRKMAEIEAQVGPIDFVPGSTPNDSPKWEWEAAAGKQRQIAARYEGKDPFVQSSHFEQPNIVVHARVKDRKDADGKRVLFVEEIQSDLASKWRESTESEEVTARRAELRAQEVALAEESQGLLDRAAQVINRADPMYARDVARSVARDLYSELRMFGDVSERSLTGNKRVAYDALREYDGELYDQMVNVANRHDEAARAVLALGTERRMDPSTPETPFLGENTYALMVKRLMRMAADEGYDALAWTPGYMQAERWNNAAQSVVEGVQWGADAENMQGEAPGDGKLVSLEMGQTDTIGFVVNDQGEIARSVFRAESLVGKKLSALLGPGLAKQIMDEPSGSVSGQKITFPDSGYAIAYDQQIKRSVEKLTKKHGAMVKIDRSLPDMRETLSRDDAAAAYVRERGLSPSQVRDILLRAEGGPSAEAIDRAVRPFMDSQFADDPGYIAASLASRFGPAFTRAAEGFEMPARPVWRVDFTDKLRVAAQTAQPLFRQREAEGVDQAPVTPAFARLAAKVEEDLNARLATVMPNGGLRLNIVPSLEGEFEDGTRFTADGMFWGNTITVALDAETLGRGAMPTFNHEVIHGLRSERLWGKPYGLFRKAEWDTLRKAALADEARMAEIRATYRDLPPEMQIEEAIADMYGEWAAGRMKNPPSLIRVAFERIKAFLDALASALRGQGFTDADMVFARIERGDVGARAGVEGGLATDADPQFARRGTFTPQAIANMRGFAPTTTALPGATGPSQPSLFGQPSFPTPERTMVDAQVENFQDRFVMLRKAQEAVEAVRGAPLPESIDAYLSQTLYDTRTSDQLQRFLENEVAGISTAMREEDVTLDDVGAFLMAKHAPERNAEMAKRDPKRFGQDGGSGLTNAQAAQLMADFAAAGKTQGLERIGAMVRKILADDLARRLNAGLITQAEHDSYRKMYEFYVPLRGSAEREDGAGQTGGIGRGFDIRGREVKAALGRMTLAANPVVQAVQMAQEGIVRAEKNRVGKTFMRFAQANPNPEMWEIIGKLPLRRVLDPATGLVKKVPDMGALKEDEVLAVKIGGKARYIRIVDPSLAVAFKNLGVERGGQIASLGERIVNALRPVTRLFGRLLTSGNPDFVLPNMQADFLEGVMTAHAVTDTKGMVRAYVKNYGPALRAAAMHEMGRSAGGKWDALMDEWKASGGLINFMAFRDLEEIADDIDVAVQGRTVAGKVINAPNELLKFVERINQPFESAGRLAMYVSARERGYSKAKAAAMALDASGNYTRRGHYTRTLSAGYVFFNAAVQGIEKFTRFAQNPKTLAVIGTVPMLGFINAMLGMALGEDEDDPEKRSLYAQIPEWERHRAIIVPWGIREDEFGRKRLDYTPIRIPHPLRPFWALGDQTAMVLTGYTTPEKAGSAILASLAMSFNPLGADNAPNAIAPTALDPFVDLYLNRTWTGTPIRPESSFGEPGAPQSNTFYEGRTREMFVAAAQGLNALTGGTRFEPGWLDVYPNNMQYLIEFAGGGFLTFITRSVESSMNAFSGVKTPPGQTPVLRTFKGTTNMQAESRRFYDLRASVQKEQDRMRTAVRNWERARGRGEDDAEALAAIRRYEADLGARFTPGKTINWKNSVAAPFTQAEKRIKELRIELYDMRLDKSLSRAQRDAERRRIENEMEEVMRKARAEFARRNAQLGGFIR